jgi:hypothetical protein
MRRSKSVDHGPANPAYGEKMHSRNLKNAIVKTLVADTIQQTTFVPI